MRKIISILIALGLILALSAIAMPAAADVSAVTVVVDPPCACVVAVYNVTFTMEASLTEGVHCVCVKFPAGTTVPATGTAWKDGDIIFDGVDVFGSEVTVTGTEVCFLPPADKLAGTYLIQFTASAGIKNPCTPGKYRLEVKTCRAPDNAYELSNAYYIIPCMSDYTFVWDSNDTYPGIAVGFVPPFKACGQNTTGAVEFATGKFQNAFDLIFMPYPEGCEAPCGAVDFYLSLVASPQFPCAGADPVSTVTLNLSGYGIIGGAWNLTYDMCSEDEPAAIKFAALTPLAANTTIPWQGYIHFDTVGEYTICVTAVCPGGTGGGVCSPTSTEDEVLAEVCFDFDVHQWKDVGKIILDEKWNLISLPLVPFDTDIDVLLASLDSEAFDADFDSDLVSIWHFDQCTDAWSVYGNGQNSLTDMVDGKSYWVRMTYPMAGNYTWYVWGTERSMPPAAPSAYSMCPGWNMFGFTSLTDELFQTYLWNLDGTANEPLVYGWLNTGDWLGSGWQIRNTGDLLVSGQGYWGAFPAAGTIIP